MSSKRIVRVACVIVAVLALGGARAETSASFVGYTGNGSSTVFPFSFKVFAAAEIEVRIKTVATGALSDPLMEGEDYLVTLSQGPSWRLGSTGSVTTAETYSAAYEIWIERRSRLLGVGGGYYMESAFRAINDLRNLYGLTLHTNPSEHAADFNLPAAEVRAGKFLAFDAAGAPTVAAMTDLTDWTGGVYALGNLSPHEDEEGYTDEMLSWSYYTDSWSRLQLTSTGTQLLQIPYQEDASSFPVWIPGLGWQWVASSSFGRGLLAQDDAAAARATLHVDGWLDVGEYGASDRDDVDDATAIQQAIDAALAQHRGLLIRRTSTTDAGYYRIDTPLTVGAGPTLAGVRIEGIRWPMLKYAGDPGGTVLTFTGLSEATVNGLGVDGNDIADVNGVKFITSGSAPAQRNTFDHLWVQNCPGVGVTITQSETATNDYYVFDQCVSSSNGVGLQIEGGSRQAEWRNGTIAESDTYGVVVKAGTFTAYNPFLALSGTSDLYLDGAIASLQIYGGASESAVILTNSSAAEGGSPLVAPVTIVGLNQAAVSPAETVIGYSGALALLLSGCKFQGHVDVNDTCAGVMACGCTFSAGDFTGDCTHVTRWLPQENRVVIGDYGFFWDADVLKLKGGVEPGTDDTYYLGRNDDDSPKAWKGLVLKDTTNSKYYRLEVTNGSVVATDLTD